MVGAHVSHREISEEESVNRWASGWYVAAHVPVGLRIRHDAGLAR
jgi:hypothetical protein